MYTDYVLSLTDKGEFKTAFDALKHFYDKGIRYGSVVDDTLKKYPLDLYCSIMNEAGLIPDSVVSLLDFTAEDIKEREKNLSDIKRLIDKMEKHKIPILMPAPSVSKAGNKEELVMMRELLTEGFAKLSDYAKSANITVALENQSSLSRADSSIDDLKYILDNANVKFVFDSGNFFCVGEDAIKAYEVFKDYIVHSHFKDWRWAENGCYQGIDNKRFKGAVLGDGFLPLRALLKRLKKDNYSGSVVLEFNSPNITIEDLDKSADFLRAEMESDI